MKQLRIILLSVALSLPGPITSLSAVPTILSHWVVAPISQVDLDENWILASRAENLIKVPVPDSSAAEEIQLGSPIEDLLIAEDLGFVLTESGELRILDPDAALDESLLGSIRLEYSYEAMALARERQLLLLAGEAGLGILDVSDPADPRLRSHIELDAPAQGIDIAGHHLIIRNGGGFVIFDLDEHLQLSELGSWSGSLSDLEARDDTVYICRHSQGFCIVSIADPARPLEVAELPIFGRSLDVQGHMAFLAGSYGVTSIDLSEIENPEVVGQMYLAGSPSEIAASGSYCAVGRGPNLFCVDVSFPLRPFPRWSLQYPDHIISMRASGTGLYVATDLGVHILGLSSPEQITQASFLKFDYQISSIDIDGDLLLAHPTTRHEFYPINIAQPGRPLSYPSWIYWFDIRDIEVTDQILYAAAAWGGLKIYDFSDPASPIFLASLSLFEPATALTLVGDLAIVQGQDPKTVLSFVDISRPAAPILSGEFPLEGWISNLISGGGLVFYSTDTKFSVLDPGNGNNARLLSSVNAGEHIVSLNWIHGQLWCGLSRGGALVYDLENPAAPHLVAIFDSGEIVRAVVSGKSFVATSASGGIWVSEGSPLVLDPREAEGRSGP